MTCIPLAFREGIVESDRYAIRIRLNDLNPVDCFAVTTSEQGHFSYRCGELLQSRTK